jgi:hypothetical protein
MRNRAVLWRVGVLAAWLAAVAGLVVLDSGSDDANWYVVVGAPLTVLVGAVINRWWVTFVPFLVAFAVAAWIVVGGATCTECTDGEGLGLWITILVGLFAFPASGALAIGVILRGLIRFFRDLPSGEEHA